MGIIKTYIVGRPLPSHAEEEQRLGKAVGLAVFASDAISSTAYATEEILFVIFGIAGFASMGYLTPMAGIVVVLLAIVATSYRQTIKAYPSGGGSYVVAKDNLGIVPALVAGASLLVDYVLTVAVSVSAGVAAIISAVPSLVSYRVLLCLAAIGILMIANLRGVKESGRLFAVPTYGYIFALAILIITGLIKVFFGHLGPIPVDHERLDAAKAGKDFVSSVGLFMLMRAFSSGAVALTGIEAISNGVGAFRKPESKNASTTLVWMASLLATLFFGISVLAAHLHPIPSEHETVLSQIARHVYGGAGAAYWVTQVLTFGILILAANTAFADFPRIASILSTDGFLPRQFANRGDRLVFSNGILVLATFSVALIVAFGGETTRLIPLYAVGVFLAFTLSQTGMVVHHFKLREPSWQRNAVINAVGAVATGIVLMVVMVSKFTVGAWVPIIIIPMVMALLWATHKHYEHVREVLMVAPEWRPQVRKNLVLVLVSGVHRSSLEALAFARSFNPDELQCVTVATDSAVEGVRDAWAKYQVEDELVVLDSPYRELTGPLLEYLKVLSESHAGWRTTVVIPELVVKSWWQHLLHNQSALTLKGRLLYRRNTVVVSVPLHLPRTARQEKAALKAEEKAALKAAKSADRSGEAVTLVSESRSE